MLRVALPVGLLALGLALATNTHRLEAYGHSPFPVTKTPRFHPEVAAKTVVPLPAVDLGEGVEVPVEHTLRRGQTLSRLLSGLGLEPTEVRAVVAAFAEHLEIRSLKAGQSLEVFYGDDSRPVRLEMVARGLGRIQVSPDGDGWSGTFAPFVEERRLRVLRGEVESSLGQSLVAEGGQVALAYRIADLLQWDLDFKRDLRRGDRFEVLYEEIYLDGEYHQLGDVLAATYDNRGRRVEAYRHGDDYFDGEGRPLQKMFLRSPLPFTRITSRFTNRRFHPVLKTYRPHYGVDYGAPVGTPVRVTANGTVTFAGWSGGGGKTIKVRHANGYLSAYLHLSRFASQVRSGTRVRQGEVIGYVGSTGLSTGPHLDYRVQHRGRWIDPLGIDNVPSEPISPQELEIFLRHRDVIRASLSSGEPPELPALEAPILGPDAVAGRAGDVVASTVSSPEAAGSSAQPAPAVPGAR